MNGIAILQECLQEAIQEKQAVQPKKRKTKTVKYPIDELKHHKIKRLYMRHYGKGEVAALAEELGLPRWKVSKYAVRQGWIAKQKKSPDWSPEEITILERNAHLCPERIVLKLKAVGFSRSTVGVVLKRKRMRLLQNLKGYSAQNLAGCLGEDVHFVLTAIRAGLLKAKRRETNRTEKQGGDPWYITEKNIRAYILENVHAIDLRKVDKYWFVDIVAGRELK